MTLEEAKARILKLYFDDNCFGEDFAIFIDEVYDDFDKELDKLKQKDIDQAEITALLFQLERIRDEFITCKGK